MGGVRSTRSEFANTLDEALDQVFGGNSGASAGDAENSGNTSQSGDGQNGTDSGDGSESNGNANGSGTNEGKDQNGSSSQGGSQSPELQQALKDAAQAMKDSQSAMKNGDWTAYGEARSNWKKPSTRPSNSTVASKSQTRKPQYCERPHAGGVHYFLPRWRGLSCTA